MACCMMIHCGPLKTRYGRALLYTMVILRTSPTMENRSTGESRVRTPHRAVLTAQVRQSAQTCVCSVVQHGHTTLTQLDLTPIRDKLDPRVDLSVFVGSDPLRRCYILETLTGKKVLSANCTFNESLFPWKQQTTYAGLHRPTLSTATSCASPLLVFLLLYLSTRTNRTQCERPKRAAPPTRKLIENTQATAANDPRAGDYTSSATPMIYSRQCKLGAPASPEPPQFPPKRL
jgi:hypothetical protein